MSVLLIIRLKEIIYSGENIGNDLSFYFDVKGQVTHVKTKISFGQRKSFNAVLFQGTFAEGSISLPISVNITEEDPVFHDTGSGSSSFNVQLQKSEPQTHSFNANVIASGGDKGKTATFTFKMVATVEDTIKVEFEEVKICEDKIVTKLSPSGVNSAFTLKLLGDQLITLVNGVNRSGGATTYTDSFDVGNLPDSKSFTKIEATWKGCTFEYSYPFEVLKNYRITVYNTPLETDFAGGSTQVKTVTASGTWSTRSYKTAFLNEVVENGSGKGTDGVTMSLEYYFVPGNYHGFPPPAEAPPQYNGFDFRRPSSVKGATGINLVVDESVAIKPTHPNLSIGDTLCVEGLGVKKVHDHGSGLVTEQLDLYKGFGAASVQGWTNPNNKVIKLL